MAQDMSQEEARRVLAEFREMFRAAVRTSIEESKKHFVDDYVEFHTMWPALLEGKDLFKALDGTRYYEPNHSSKVGTPPSAAVSEEYIRTIGDSAIIYITTGENAKLEPNGTISYHMSRITVVYVKMNGKWFMASGHHNPPAPEGGPYGHNQFLTGQLGYTTAN